jgi:hypothetical protein
MMGVLAQPFVLADLAAEIESVDPGQHDIEKKERRLGHGGLGNDRRPGEKCGNFISGRPQVVFDQLGHIRIVFDDIDQIGVTRFACRRQRMHD